MKPTGPTDPNLRMVITKLKRGGAYHSNLARLLSKPARRRAEVNLSKISRLCKDGEAIVIPGKVLGKGDLTKKVTIFAWSFSESAQKKISKVGKIFPIEQLTEKNIKPRVIC